jgi:hypothetical protein
MRKEPCNRRKAINSSVALSQNDEINYENFKMRRYALKLFMGSIGRSWLSEGKLQEKMNVIFEEVLPVSPVLGAHTGPTFTGLIIGPMSLFADLI